MSEPTAILVASGDEGLRAQVRLTLGDERFQVGEAQDTAEAIRAIVTDRPAMVVVDLELPGQGALALVRSTRSQPETAGVRTLVLVPRGRLVPDDTEGVDAVLAVPSTSFAMLRKVDTLLD